MRGVDPEIEYDILVGYVMLCILVQLLFRCF